MTQVPGQLRRVVPDRAFDPTLSPAGMADIPHAMFPYQVKEAVSAACRLIYEGLISEQVRAYYLGGGWFHFIFDLIPGVEVVGDKCVIELHSRMSFEDGPFMLSEKALLALRFTEDDPFTLTGIEGPFALHRGHADLAHKMTLLTGFVGVALDERDLIVERATTHDDWFERVPSWIPLFVADHDEMVLTPGVDSPIQVTRLG